MKNLLLALLAIAPLTSRAGYLWNSDGTKCYEVKGATQASRPIGFDDKAVDPNACERRLGAEKQLVGARVTCGKGLLAKHFKIPSNEALAAADKRIRHGDFSVAELMSSFEAFACDKGFRNDDDAFRAVIDDAAKAHRAAAAENSHGDDQPKGQTSAQ